MAVHEHDIEIALPGHPHRLLAVVDDGDTTAEGLEVAERDLPVHGVVLGHQDVAGQAGDGGRGPGHGHRLDNGLLAQLAAQQIVQVLLADRFAKIRVDAGGVGAGDVAVARRRAEHHQRDVAQPGRGAQAVRDVDAVLRAQVQVQQGDIPGGRPRRRRYQRLDADAVRGGVAGHAPGFGEAAQDLQVGAVVVDDQQVAALQVVHVAVVAVPAFVALGQTQAEPEHRALAGPAAHADGAAHQFDEAPRDRQAQAGAAVPARGRAVGLHEGLEDALLRLRRDADAGILDLAQEREPVGILALRHDAQLDAAAFGELDRIADQVHQHLLDTVGVAAQPARRLAGDVHGQFEALAVGRHGHQVRDVLEQVPQGEFVLVDLKKPRLDLREVEDVVDDHQQRVAGLLDRVHEVPLAVIHLGRGQQLGHAQDAVHRRADLVAHRGQELALGAAGRLGLVAGLEGFAHGQPQLLVARGQLGRALGNRLLQPGAVVRELAFAHLDLGDHLVEHVDQVAELVAAASCHARAVVLVLGDGVHGRDDLRERPREDELQARGQRRHDGDGHGQDDHGDPVEAQQHRVQRALVVDQVDHADLLVLGDDRHQDVQPSAFAVRHMRLAVEVEGALVRGQARQDVVRGDVGAAQRLGAVGCEDLVVLVVQVAGQHARLDRQRAQDLLGAVRVPEAEGGGAVPADHVGDRQELALQQGARPRVLAHDHGAHRQQQRADACRQDHEGQLGPDLHVRETHRPTPPP